MAHTCSSAGVAFCLLVFFYYSVHALISVLLYIIILSSLDVINVFCVVFVRSSELIGRAAVQRRSVSEKCFVIKVINSIQIQYGKEFMLWCFSKTDKYCRIINIWKSIKPNRSHRSFKLIVFVMSQKRIHLCTP